MQGTIAGRIQPHNARPAAVWSAGGKDYDEISRGIADALEHCVLRLNPQPGERILDLSTGTGWTSRLVARRGAIVTGVDIAEDLIAAARARAEAERLPIMPQPSAPAPASPFEWGKIERQRELLGRAFQLRFEDGVSYYREPSGDAAWQTFSTGYGPTRSLAANLDADRRAALRAEFTAFHAGFATDLGICVPRAYRVTIGERV